MVYDNKPRRNLFVDRKFRIQVCSQTILDIYENVMLYNNKTFSIFLDIFLLTNVADFSNRKSSDFPKIVQPFSQKKSYAHKMKNS